MPAALRPASADLAARLITAWALAGGVVLLALVGLNLWSVLADALLGRPYPGTIELTEVGTAVAVFAFLPYCQLTGANVTVDIFTTRARPSTLRWMAFAAAALALAFALFLVWRMSHGLLDQRAARLTTTILQLPVWIAFVPVVISLVLLAIAALITLTRAPERGA